MTGRIKHGAAVRGQKRPGTYSSWAQMRSRCNNPKVPEYSSYGARGIKVCERWESFENFLADMGERPCGASIDRIDVNGGYEPGNCRWATRSVQARNTTRTRVICRDGVSKPLCDWITELGLNPNTVRGRLRRGWTEAEALTR